MSQTEQILKYMRSSPITAIEALRKFKCFRLAARIRDLRDRGHQIITLKVQEEGKTFARYVLVKERL